IKYSQSDFSSEAGAAQGVSGPSKRGWRFGGCAAQLFWRGLCCDEVLALINNWMIHKIGDLAVVGRLRKSIGGISDGLWKQLPSLAPGQAIASFTSMTRPLL